MDAKDIAAIAQALQKLCPTPTSQAPATTVSAVSLKLPSFWTTRPEVWFKQVEAQFATRSPPITADLTQFNYVVAALDSATAGEVEAVILNPPTNNKYEALKSDLIGAYGKTQAAKDMELLTLSGLGDRKPSSLLRYIQSLNADPTTLLRAVFLAQMPREVRRILASSKATTLHDLAKEADAIVEAGVSGLGQESISGVQNPTPSKAPIVVSTGPFTCMYHKRFKEKARNCIRGCSMSHLVPPSPSTSSLAAKGNAHAGR
jgi:hypothetical protein